MRQEISKTREVVPKITWEPLLGKRGVCKLQQNVWVQILGLWSITLFSKSWPKNCNEVESLKMLQELVFGCLARRVHIFRQRIRFRILRRRLCWIIQVNWNAIRFVLMRGRESWHTDNVKAKQMVDGDITSWGTSWNASRHQMIGGQQIFLHSRSGWGQN